MIPLRYEQCYSICSFYIYIILPFIFYLSRLSFSSFLLFPFSILYIPTAGCTHCVLRVRAIIYARGAPHRTGGVLHHRLTWITVHNIPSRFFLPGIFLITHNYYYNNCFNSFTTFAFTSSLVAVISTATPFSFRGIHFSPTVFVRLIFFALHFLFLVVFLYCSPALENISS